MQQSTQRHQLVGDEMLRENISSCNQKNSVITDTITNQCSGQQQQQQIEQSSSSPWTKDVLYSVASRDNKKIVTADQTNNTTKNNQNNNHQHNNSSSNSKATTTTNSQSSSSNGASSTVIGHYELKRTLGKGNFSTVKLAEHKITHHNVAIKVVKTSVLSADNFKKINREIDVLKKLGKHEHIVRLYQVIKTRRYFMLVTEYCANGELYDYLVDKGKLPESKACNYFLQILSAVEYLHNRNVVHRDLKAENLLLTNDYKTIKIVDFGFANYYKQDKLLSTWCGSPPYAAPELFKGLQYVGPPVDIWSMGVILYVLVCGTLPFDGGNLVFLKNRVLSGKFRIPFFMSTECEGLIRGMLRLDPDRRFKIRRIRAHDWIVKYSGQNTVALNDQKAVPTSTTPNNTSATILDSSSSLVPDATKANIIARSVKNLDKNNIPLSSADQSCEDTSSSTRGMSLDLEDDKTKLDTSKLTTASSATKGTNSQIMCSVDIEMANAVSNMSLDSNNSSMSVSQSVDNSYTLSNHSGAANQSVSMTSSRMNISQRMEATNESNGSNSTLSKKNSVDDQIIEYMVDILRIAPSPSSIRESIANDHYDDLHAIYRLLKDQPGTMFEILEASKKFKIPSLPLISLNKQQISKKPSITTGFFSTPLDTEQFNRSAKKDVFINEESTKRNQDNNRYQFNLNARPINLVTNSSTEADSRPKRLSDDQASWAVPPQLFLTPPSDIRSQQMAGTGHQQQQVSDLYRETEFSPTIVDINNNNFKTTNSNQTNRQVARHSFDSTIQQLNASNLPSNQLTLGNQDNPCLWDSSILDTLGVSTPSPLLNFGSNDSSNGRFSNQNMEMGQNLAGITTHLPQIGQYDTQTSPMNQNLLIAQLNSMALTAMTQSNMFGQCESGQQKNNALNNAKMNNIASQINPNNNCIPNLSLLDPNGLISSLERRASDGQANYRSLSTDEPNKNQYIVANNTSDANVSTTATACPINMNNPMLSSSLSNQLSSFNQNMGNMQINYCQGPNGQDYNHMASSPSNNSTLLLNGQHSLSPSNQSALPCGHNGRVDVGIRPLDLTKNSRESGPLDATSNSPLTGNVDKTDLNYYENHTKQELICKVANNQRSNSTTSASIIFNHHNSSPKTSPQGCHFSSSSASNSNYNSCGNNPSPYSQVSPSSLSLTGGGPGHLLNRRKRHSLETESRHLTHYHYQQQLHQQHNQPHGYHHPHKHIANTPMNNNTNSNSMRKQQNYHQDSPNRSALRHNTLQYPMDSHIGQLRNFAQNFTYKKLMKRQATSPIMGSVNNNDE